MTPRCRVAVLPLAAALLHASSGAAATPTASFQEATRDDLEGKPQIAFATYLNAAKAGLPEAEFNVAVMLDSGRGVNPDLAQAATWYARAAAHGIPRAAYNLGQLYETGQGVPRNTDLARAWFEASKLPAAHDHLVERRSQASDRRSPPIAPNIVAPAIDGKIRTDEGGVELVWTSKTQPEPAQYYVEIYSVGKSSPQEVYTRTTQVSSIFVDKIGKGKNYIWRVTALFKKSGQYMASEWSSFQVE